MRICLNFPTFAALITVIFADWVELPMLSPTVAPATTIATEIFTNPSSISSKIDSTKGLHKTSEGTTTRKQPNINSLHNKTNSNIKYTSPENNDENPEALYNSYVKEQLMRVNDELTSEPHDTIGSKLKFLKQFERKLLTHVEVASKDLWVDRQGRGHKHKHMGFGVELPLLTIALLTFAVFLVKIVQQIIQAVQANNAQTDTGTMLIVPQPIRKRHRRNIDDLTTATIFQYMDDFKIHHILNHEL